VLKSLSQSQIPTGGDRRSVANKKVANAARLKKKTPGRTLSIV